MRLGCDRDPVLSNQMMMANTKVKIGLNNVSYTTKCMNDEDR